MPNLTNLSPTLNQILDIAFVLVAVYATLSCVCSWINEKIASWLRLRGWNLFKGVLALVDTHDMAAAIFNHPLIASTSSYSKKIAADGTVTPQIPADQAKTRPQRYWQIFQMKPPSYCDARNFSSSVWQVIASKYPDQLRAAVQAIDANFPHDADGQTALAQLLVSAPNQVLGTLTTTVRSIAPPNDLQRQLLALLTQAGQNYTGLLAATDGWFNAQMDRVSGWYKRDTQWIMAAITFAVVTFTGVDTIEVVRVLSATDGATLTKLADSVNLNASPNASASDGNPQQAVDITRFVHFAKLQDPVLANWTEHVMADPKDPKRITYLRAPGLIVTYLALLLGGPFWFDALKALANVRSAGRKPSRKDQPTPQ